MKRTLADRAPIRMITGPRTRAKTEATRSVMTVERFMFTLLF